MADFMGTLKSTIRMAINVAKATTAKDEKRVGGNIAMKKANSPRRSGKVCRKIISSINSSF
jgi:hypothetical protein|tara:strand:- start:219 stop:401 length:183 start_codon:yes stop_codon:yes gene_type:complete